MIKENILAIAKEHNGMITSKHLRDNSIPTIYLTRLENEGKIYKVEKGVYLTEDGTYDEYFFFQYRYPKVIYSHVLALYFLGLTDKIPQTIDITVPYSYKFNERRSDINIRYVKPEIYSIGISEIKTIFGNLVKVYDAERTICDLIIDKEKIESEIYVTAIRMYVKDKNRDIKKLLTYAKEMEILEKVRNIMEVYFE